MVGIVSGNSLGVSNSSGATLGDATYVGGSRVGLHGDKVTVNAVTGNLVLQRQDDFLASTGEDDLAIVRTYNSLGQFDDDNGDNWQLGQSKKLVFSTSFPTASPGGTTVTRIDGDGATAVYAYASSSPDGSKLEFISNDGAGSTDRLTFDAQLERWTWNDGASNQRETYDAAGRISSTRDHTYSYTSAGLVASVVDHSGSGAYFTYGGASGRNLIGVDMKYAAGGALQTAKRVSYTYDGQSRLYEVTTDLSPQDGSISDANVFWTRYSYDGNSKRVSQIEQKDGGLLRIAYEAGSGRVDYITDDKFETQNFDYASSTTTTVTDQDGLVTRFEYDAQGQLKAIVATPTAGPVQTQTFEYDANGNVVAFTDAAGNLTTRRYDAYNNCVYERNAANDIITRVFDPIDHEKIIEETRIEFLNVVEGIEVLGEPMSTRYIYDAAGEQLRFVVNAANGLTEYRYNGALRTHTINYIGLYAYVESVPPGPSWRAELLAQMEAQAYPERANVMLTQHWYDLQGQVSQTTVFGAIAADGTGIFNGTESTSHFTHDQAGQLVHAIDPNGNQVSHAYDGLGRTLMTVASPYQGVNESTVTVMNDVPTMRLVGGVALATTSSAVTYADGHGLITISDASGRVVSSNVTDRAGQVIAETLYRYDSAGRLNAVQAPNGATSYIFYDASGRRAVTVDGDGSTVLFKYSAKGDLIKTTQLSNAVDVQAMLGQLGKTAGSARAEDFAFPLSTSDDRHEWRAYDGAGRLARIVDGAGQVTDYKYDNAGRLLEVLTYANAIDQPQGDTVSLALPPPSTDDRAQRYRYTTLDKVRYESDADGETYYSYDSFGQLGGEWRQGANSSKTYIHDLKGLVRGEIDEANFLTEFEYDGNGNVVRKTRYAQAVQAEWPFTLDSLRPTNPAVEKQIWTYDYVANRLAREVGPDGTATVYAYDQMGRLMSTTAAYNTLEARTNLVRRDDLGQVIAELSGEGASRIQAGMTAAEINAVWAAYAVTYTYDGSGQRTSMTDQNGNKFVYYYDADGRLAASISSDGEVTYREYNTFNEIEKITRFATHLWSAMLPLMNGGQMNEAVRSILYANADPTRDVVTSYQYNRLGQVAVLNDQQGEHVMEYNAFGEVRTLSTAYSVATMSYDTFGRLRSRVTASPTATAEEWHQYDELGREIYRSSGGIGVEISYDDLGRPALTKQTMSDGVATKYDAFGRLEYEISALGHKTTYSYNTAGRSMTVTTPEGVVTTVVNNRHGQQQSVTVGQDTTTYHYDLDGNVVLVSDALGTQARTVFDRAGNAELIYGKDGVATKVSYDAAGRVLTTAVDPDGLNLVTSYAYDGIGQVLSVTSPAGVIETSRYDEVGNLRAHTVDAGGLDLTTEYEYDARGLLVAVINPKGKSTTFSYDGLGRRLTETVDADGLALTTRFTYDSAGNVSTRTDANEHVTRFYYDANNRLVNQVDGAGGLTHFEYDGANRLIRTTVHAEPIDPSLLPEIDTPLNYDPVISLATPDAARDIVTHHVYDRDGRLRFVVDGAGAVAERLYDAQNRLAKTIEHAGRIGVAAAYTQSGISAALAAFTDRSQDVSTTLVYDKRGRVADSINGKGGVTHYDYEGDRVVAITGHGQAGGPALTRQLMSYDGAGRLTGSATAQRIDGNGTATAWAVTKQEYDRAGNLIAGTAYATALTAPAPASSAGIKAWMDGVPAAPASDAQQRYVYDGANRRVAQATAQYMAEGELLWALATQNYDGAGNVVQTVAYADLQATDVMESWPDSGRDRITSFDYDGANRLRRSVDAAGAVKENHYDATGRVIETRQYGNSQIGPMPSEARIVGYEYDQAGRTIVSDRERREYDAAGNMVRLVEGERVQRFIYDTDGRLRFAIDALGFVKETVYDGVGRVSATLVWNSGVAAGQEVTDVQDMQDLRPAGAAFQPVETRYTYDALGNVTSTTDALGHTEYTEFDGLGRKSAFVNKLNQRWTYELDAAGRVIAELTPQVSVTADDGSVTVQGITTQFAYDTLGNVAARTEAAGSSGQRTTTYGYDLAGRQVRTTMPLVKVYDSATETHSIVGVERNESLPGAGATTTVAYDAFGNAVRNVDALGNVTQKIYSPRGDLQFDIDALGYVTRYQHDAFGNVTRLTRYSGTLASSGASTTVAQLYFALLGRAPEPEALAFWTGGPRAELSFEEMAERILASDEAQAYFPVGMSLTSFIEQVYALALGRAPSAEELDNMVFLGGEGMTRGSLVDQIIYGINQEGDLRTWNAKLETVLLAPNAAAQLQITQIYAALFHRSPTAWELQDALDSFERGMEGAMLADMLLSSEEGLLAYPDQEAGFGFIEALAQSMLGHSFDDGMWTVYDAMRDSSLGAGVMVMIDTVMRTESADRAAFSSRVTAALGLSPSYTFEKRRLDEQAMLAALRRQDTASMRVVQMTYDSYNRLLTSLEGQSWYHQRNGDWEGYVETFQAGRLTTNHYNQYGELMERRVAGGRLETNPFTDVETIETTPAAITRYLHNARGELIGELTLGRSPFDHSDYEWEWDWDERENVPATGAYYTARQYDVAGNLTQVTEYARGADAESFKEVRWSQDRSHSDLAAEWENLVQGALGYYDDENNYVADERGRTTKYVYDALNRKTEEWTLMAHVDQPGAATPVPRQDIHSEFGYDSIGNLTTMTDELGGVTRSHYDALGRVVAVTRQGKADEQELASISQGAQTARVSLTTFGRDVHGNVVRSVAHANGALAVDSATAKQPGPDDRITQTRYDLNGNAIEIIDALQHSSYASYDLLGRVVKQWESVTQRDARDPAAGSRANTIFTITHYDAVGHVVGVTTPGTTSEASASSAVRVSAMQSSQYIEPEPGEGAPRWEGDNRVALSYPPVTGGAVSVTMNYTLASGGQAAPLVFEGGASHASYEWNEAVAGGGIGGIESIVVSYVDANGVSHVAYEVSGAALFAVATIDDLPQGTFNLKQQTNVYNSFGEVTARALDGVQYEYTYYDNVGNAWCTNAGDGVDKLLYYTIGGQVGLQLRAANAESGSEGDLKKYRSLAEVDPESGAFERVETRYDTLGRVTERITAGSNTAAKPQAPAQVVTTGIAQVRTEAAGTQWADVGNEGDWMGTNKAIVDFHMPLELGSGDVMVVLNYTTVSGGAVIEAGNGEFFPEPPGGAQEIKRVIGMKDLTRDSLGRWNAKLAWGGTAPLDPGAIDRVQVYKMDVNGAWVLLSSVETPPANRLIAVSQKTGGPFLLLGPDTDGAGISAALGVAPPHVFGSASMIDLSQAVAGKHRVHAAAIRADGVPTWAGETFSLSITTSSAVNNFAAISERDMSLPETEEVAKRVVHERHDRWGNLVAASDLNDADLQTRYTYNERNQRTGESVVQRGRDANGNPTREVLRSSSTYYDALGRQVGTRDAEGNVNRIVYDSEGNAAYALNAENALERSEFNLFGERTSLTRSRAPGEDLVVHYGYDRLGRVERTWMDGVESHTMTKIHDGSGMLISGPTLETATQRFVYDELGRRIGMIDSDGGQTRTSYDLDGNVVATADAAGVVMRYVYDAFHHKVMELDAEGKSMRWTYAPGNGTLDSHTDMSGKNVYYGYDGMRRLTSQTSDPRGTEGKAQDLAFTYDDAGLLSRIDDGALKQTTTYQYDRAGNRVREKIEVATTLAVQDGGQYPTGEAAEAMAELYLTLLQRGPDLNGLAFFIDAHTVQRKSIAELADSMFASPETQHYFPATMTPVEFVTLLFSNAYGRAPTAAERDGLVAQLAGGATRGEVVVSAIGAMHGAERGAFDARIVAALQAADTSPLEMVHTVQDNRIEYDQFHRMEKVNDGRYRVAYAYDLNGNRKEVTTSYTDENGVAVSTKAFNTYDKMNRQLIVNGEKDEADPAAVETIGKYGHLLAYDGLGNRTSDTYMSSPNSGATTVVETYEYDTAGRLKHTLREGWIVDMRKYDVAGRLLQSGAATYTYQESAEDDYKAALVRFGMDTGYRSMAYDAAGRLLRQKEHDVDGAPGTDIKYELGNHWAANQVGYDRAGHLKGYYVVPADAPDNEELYTVTYAHFDSYVQASMQVQRGGLVGTTVSDYDQNGFLTRVRQQAIGKQEATERTFVNDAAGRVLEARSGSEVMYSMIVNGEVLGNTGGAGGDATPGIFGSTYEPSRVAVNSSAPFVYIVQADEESLQSIAKSVWGDSKLWYLIADANGGVQQVTKGMALQMPARVNTVHNDYQTYRPYDPSRMVGDTTPTLPAPAAPKGCGTAGMILMIVVAVVATIVTAGAALAAMGAAGTTLGAGVSAFVAGTASAGSLIAAGAIGGAVGSILSQGVGMAIGMQDKFSWTGVAVGALGGAVSGGVAAYAPGVSSIFAGKDVGAVAARAMLSTAVTQGVSSVTKLQGSFSWRNVAATGIASVVTQNLMGQPAESANWSDMAQGIAGATGAGIIGSATAAGLTRGRVNFKQVFTDAFGNALGSGLAEGMKGMSKIKDPFDGIDMQSELKKGELTAALSGVSGTPISSWNGDNELTADFDPSGRLYANEYEYANRDVGERGLLPTPDITANDLTMQRVVITGKRPDPQSLEDEYKYLMRASMPGFGTPDPVTRRATSLLLTPKAKTVRAPVSSDPRPITTPISNEDFVNWKSLDKAKIREIINARNPRLIDLEIDEFVYATSRKYELNPRVLLATLAQEQNWGLNGKVSKIAGIDGGGGGNPIDLPIGKSIDMSAATYRKHFNAALGNDGVMNIKINHDPKDNEQRAVFGKGLGAWQVDNASVVDSLRKGYVYQTRAASEYAKLKYTPFTYFPPQQSRPYDAWVKLYNGF